MAFGFGFGMPRSFATPFSPASLFATGATGTWYDPSDRTTLFQDSAGTTPVTAVEQPVGLMLDKSQGLVLGPQLVTNGDFSNGTTGWTGNNATIAVESGRLKVTVTTVADSRARQTISGLTAGRFYTVTGQFQPSSDCRVRANGVIANTVYSSGTSNQSFTFCFPATSSTATLDLDIASAGAWMQIGQFAYFDNISVRELPGNHAFQSTAASRPVLSARKNWLLATETLSTQNVTVLAGQMVLSFYGTGTVTLSGTSTAGPLVGTGVANRVSLTFTPTAGTLTLTVSGSVTQAQLEYVA